MADEVIRAQAVQSAPAGYTVPGAQEIIVKSVRALVDGSNAAASFLAVLQLIAPDDSVVWEAQTDSTIAAGGSANVSWFPRVGGVVSTTTTVATLATVALFQTGQSIPSGGYTTIAFDTLLSAHDPLGVFSIDLATGIVTTTVTGVFTVATFLGFQTTHSGHLRLLQNGTAGTFGKSEDDFSANSDLACAGALNSNAGQSFQSLIFQDSGSSLPIFRARSTLAMLAPTP